MKFLNLVNIVIIIYNYNRTELFMSFSEQIRTLIHDYSQQKQDQILQKILSVKLSQTEQQEFNQKYQQSILDAFKNLMSRQKIDDLCSLLNLIWKSLRNSVINKSVLITTLDNVLECVGVEDLKKILSVIRQRVGQLGQLQSKISFPFLKIINTLLKRISKATDFQVRGQLHLTITKIISFCHQSGFQYRPGTSPVEDKLDIKDTLLDSFKQSNISLQFYQSFWQLQKYFMDLQQLIKHENSAVATPSKQDPKLMIIRLKKIQSIMDDTLSFFKINPPVDNKNFETFPIKFFKLPNLLAVQLQDSYFRLTILVQALIFCESLKFFPSKHPMELSTESKAIVNRIQKKVRDYIEQIIKIRTDTDNLIKILNKMFENDTFWIQLKDNWRERKKTFFKTSIQQIPQNKKTPSITESAPVQNIKVLESNQQKKSYNLPQLAAKCRKEIQKKIQIKSNFIQHFLAHSQAPVLKKQPISPSFAYFYNQARHCMETFDQKEQCQTQFETRSEYNLFQWKAFRSLERERIVTGLQGDKNSKLAEYKLLDFIKRKEDLFEGAEPRKRVKLSDEQKKDE